MCIMYFFYISIFFLSSTHALSNVHKNNSEEHWFKYQEKDYLIDVGNKRNFYAAIEYCNSKKMQLVALETKEEDDAVHEQVKSLGFEFIMKYWTSGTKITNYVDWTWISTANTITYTNWFFDNPGIDDGECIQLWCPVSPGWWANDGCGEECIVICETRD